MSDLERRVAWLERQAEAQDRRINALELRLATQNQMISLLRGAAS